MFERPPAFKTPEDYNPEEEVRAAIIGLVGGPGDQSWADLERRYNDAKAKGTDADTGVSTISEEWVTIMRNKAAAERVIVQDREKEGSAEA